VVVGGIWVVRDVPQVCRFHCGDLIDDETLVGGRVRRIFSQITKRCAKLVVQVPELLLFAGALVSYERATAESEFCELLEFDPHTLG